MAKTIIVPPATPGDVLPVETETPAPTTIGDAITEAALDGIASASGDGQSVTKTPIRDLIAADEHQANKAAGRRKGLGIRFVKMTPPGNDC